MNFKVSGTAPRSESLLIPLGLIASCIVLAQVTFAQNLPEPNWDADAALQVVELAAQDPAQQQLQSGWRQQLEAGQAASVLAELQQSPQAANPAFEAQLQQLAISLAEAPLDTEVDALLRWLSHYTSTVLVAHEESAQYGVPLFPVAAAATGSLAERQRRRGQQMAVNALSTAPETWVQHYQAAHALEREGMLVVLRSASAESVLPLAQAIQTQLPVHAELAAPAAVLASSLSDPQLFLAAYQYSQGADSPQLLREASWRLDAAQRSVLFTELMALPTTDKTGLAISMLAPELQSNPAVSSLLLKLLDDPELGAAAALALAGHPDPKVQAQLQDQLQSGGVKAQRAAWALDRNLSRDLTRNPEQNRQSPGDQQ